MAHVVTARCIGCRHTDCCEVCPVECFYEVKDPPMLVIDPDTCIDCESCVPQCPVHAIYPLSELPECYAEWADKNAELVEQGENITKKKGPLPGVRTLADIKKQEEEDGLSVDEPSRSS